MIPEFNQQGNLPFGLYEATEEELLNRFATTPCRQALARKLREVFALARESNLIGRIVVWGSFVTAKPHPEDIDLLLIAKEHVVPEQVSTRFQVLFDYALARQRFGMDVFWIQAQARMLLQEFLEMARTGRNREPRGIVEIEMK